MSGSVRIAAVQARPVSELFDLTFELIHHTLKL
jgi:hypothetical protein